MSQQIEIGNIEDCPILGWEQLSHEEQKEFDYLVGKQLASPGNEPIPNDFVRYRGITYDMGEFIAVAQSDEQFLSGSVWDGFAPSGFFSGTVCKYLPDVPAYRMGAYLVKG